MGTFLLLSAAAAAGGVLTTPAIVGVVATTGLEGGAAAPPPTVPAAGLVPFAIAADKSATQMSKATLPMLAVAAASVQVITDQ